VRHVMILLTSIAMVGTSVASFSGNAHADGGQVAAGILGGLAAGTILWRRHGAPSLLRSGTGLRHAPRLC
jgi:hypothetical protein